MVPFAFSSANALIVIAGIRIRYIQGAREKRGSREANPEDNIFKYSLGAYVHKNRELIKRKSTNTIGPIKELKKYRISFFKMANIKTNLWHIYANLRRCKNSLLTLYVYKLICLIMLLSKKVTNFRIIL